MTQQLKPWSCVHVCGLYPFISAAGRGNGQMVAPQVFCVASRLAMGSLPQQMGGGGEHHRLILEQAVSLLERAQNAEALL